MQCDSEDSGADDDIYRITAWDKVAEYFGDKLQLGTTVLVGGSVGLRSYTSSQGQALEYVSINAFSISFLSAPEGSNSITERTPAAEKSSYSDYVDVDQDRLDSAERIAQAVEIATGRSDLGEEGYDYYDAFNADNYSAEGLGGDEIDWE